MDEHTEDQSMQDATTDALEAAEQAEPVSPEPVDVAEPVAARSAEPPVPIAVTSTRVPRRGVSQAPFLAYLALWVVYIVASATLLFESARTTGVLYTDRYEYAVYAAAALAALGPIVALSTWIGTRWRRTEDERRGLFAASMLAGAGVTFVGSVMWLVLLFVLDLYHAGVFS